MEELEVKYIKILYLKSQQAVSGPPLGTILGNLGVNTVKFCNEFNNECKNLPTYFSIKVIIKIYENRTCSFFIQNFSITYAIKLLKFNKILKIKEIQEKEYYCIFLNDLILLALFKFPKMVLKKSISILFSVLKSMKIIVVLK